MFRPLILQNNPGRIAQRESVPFTRERSKVRSLVRPPFISLVFLSVSLGAADLSPNHRAFLRQSSAASIFFAKAWAARSLLLSASSPLRVIFSELICRHCFLLTLAEGWIPLYRHFSSSGFIIETFANLRRDRAVLNLPKSN